MACIYESYGIAKVGCLLDVGYHQRRFCPFLFEWMISYV